MTKLNRKGGRNNLLILIILIIAIQVIIRCFLNSKFYLGHCLSCGDSSAYFGLALDWTRAAADRPSGFPFFLSYILDISLNHYVFLLINNTLGIFSQIFLFLILAILFKNKNWQAWALSWLLFANPIMWQIDALLFMTETFSLFLLLLGILLILYRAKYEWLQVIFYILGVICFAYLTITKSIFIYFSPLLLIYLCGISWHRFRYNVVVKSVLIGLFLLVYGAVPYFYTYYYAIPNTGNANLQNFAGRSIWANVMPYVSCDEMLVMNEHDGIEQLLVEECLYKDRTDWDAMHFLWDPNSLMNKMERKLGQADRIDGNNMWQEWLLKMARKKPQILLYAAGQSIYEYMWQPLSDQINFTSAPYLPSSCVPMIEDYFGQQWQEYYASWVSNYQNNRLLFEGLDFLALWFSRIVNILSILMLVLFWPIVLIKRWRWDFLTVYWWLLCVGYLFIIALGGYYVTRYYINFNALVLIFVGYFLAKYWRQIKTNPKN